MKFNATTAENKIKICRQCRTLTTPQLDRLRNLAASGPLQETEHDAYLLACGWIQVYEMFKPDDNEPVTYELVDGAVEVLYASNGSVHQVWENARINGDVQAALSKS